jgi:hypothetical protein
MKSKTVPDIRTHQPVSKLPDKYATAVGHIVFTWAQVERHLFMIEKRLCGVDTKTARKTFRWRPATKVLLNIQKTAEEKSFFFSTSIQTLKEQFSDAEDDRDILCHSAWYSSENTLFVQRVKGVRQLKGIRTDRKQSPEGIPAAKYLSTVLKDVQDCLRISKKLLSETRPLTSSGKE